MTTGRTSSGWAVQIGLGVLALLIVAAASALLALGSFLPLAAITGIVLIIATVGLAARAEQTTIRWLFLFSVGYAISTALWPRYVALWIPGLPSLNPTRLLNALVVALLFAGLISSPHLRGWLRASFLENKGVWLSLAVFVLFRFLSISVSDYPLQSTYTFANEFFVHVVMFLLGILWIRFDSKLHGLCFIALFALVVVALVGVVEWRLAKPLFGQFVDPSNAYVEWAVSGKMRDGVYRGQSTLGYPIAFAEFAVLAAGIALGGGLVARKWWVRGALLTGIPVMLAAAVVSSGSRSGYLAGALVVFGVFAASGILQAVQKRVSLARALFWVMGSAVLAVIFSVALNVAVDRAFGSGADRVSDSYRIKMHERAAKLATQSPLLGYGVGRAAYEIKVLNPGGSTQYSIDSYFLSVLVDSGCVAFVAFISAVLLACLNGFKRSIRAEPEVALRWSALVVALLGELLFKSITSLYDNNLFLFALVGCLVATQHQLVDKRS